MMTAVQIRARAQLEKRRRRATSGAASAPVSAWTESGGVYINRDTGKRYTPHHEDERQFVYSDGPRRVLVKGGEGGGKSVAGIIKDLERLRRGMSGIMGSPDFEHFKRSLWPEFARWCPWQHVIPEQRYRSRAGWEPNKPFTLTFHTPFGGTATLLCGGFDEPGAWEGPNVHFAHFDEPRRHKTPAMIKVLEGRCRIPGSNGEPPQYWLTTTPRKHWLYEYFGPWDKPGEQDPRADFKAESLVIDLLTADNERAGNLTPGFTQQRRQALTEAEARVLLGAAWEDIDDIDRFLPSIALWDACQETVPPLDRSTPCVLAVDAGESNDTFATILVSRHPTRPLDVAVRYARAYVPKPGVPLDFDAIEQDLRDLCARYAVQQLAYDPFLLGQMIRRLKQRTPDGRYGPLPAPCEPFPQTAARLEADKQLYDVITQRRIAHDGSPDLRAHLDNADRKVDPLTRKIRIVKRIYALKIDLAVCLSMGVARALAVLPRQPVTPPNSRSTRTW